MKQSTRDILSKIGAELYVRGTAVGIRSVFVPGAQDTDEAHVERYVGLALLLAACKPDPEMPANASAVVGLA